MKVVKENILTKEINLPIINSAQEKGEGWIKILRKKLKKLRTEEIKE